MRQKNGCGALFADPLQDTLHIDAPIGLLGIEPHTRRRNRMNGTVENLSADGFSVRVKQSFGNCPKYIQARPQYFSADAAADDKGKILHRTERLDHAMCDWIEAADTFFITTAFTGDNTEELRQYGVDVSRREVGVRPDR